ncbi:alpha-1,2-mannosidase, putative [Amycolatopsis xylanica]|uniref:Alpha-1,2-mannosidase, putative n=1 Tax=Amycolatopsis xylanica TaxID=589385 RepID=A0A1H3EJ25_9PSEU|nr:lectin [Amycolatopsis xylanica]SDX78595.1 alpha-1,2-mannosidase, putative [Amycolatopsis xylanica]
MASSLSRTLAVAVLALGVLTPATASAAAVADPASVVNPFIGTTNLADDFPGADAPFGMVQWSPDTPSRPDGGGYDYKDSSITGFSLTHMSGPGCGANGDVPIMPTTGSINTGATAGFAHSGESADAGYYSVGLNSGIKTELTATTRSGMGRFTFPATTNANLIFKLNGSQNGTFGTSWQVVSTTEVSGSVTSGHFCGAGNTYTVYFDMVFDQPFVSSGSTAGPNAGYVTFNTTANQVVQAKVGISYVSKANAVANRVAENPNWNFAATRQATHTAWNALLGRIQITGGTAAQQRVFYTALYHALLHPNVFSDTNGQYIGFDKQIHTVPSGHAQYANFSGWDTYRTQAQLSALVAPHESSDAAQSMVNDYAHSGMLPKWAQNNGESYVMVGDPGTAIIASYHAFGARDFDTTAALAAMVKEASTTNNIRPGLNYLTSHGYLPSNGSYGCCNFYGPVATQLEYDSADFALSAFAGALGDTANQNKFATKAQNWRNTFNPASGFMQPRLLNGAWAAGFNPSSGSNFVEGSSWQYTGMVPFNVAGLAAAKGGTAAMISYLDSVLTSFDGAGGSRSDMGNEPSLYLPWEYDYVGQPYKTQQVVRKIQNQIWTDTPGGLAGNDDLGEMSAWYVFSALGMYPETPGTADLALGSPLFTQAVITLPTGNTLTINAPSAATNAPYVQSASWNGAAWNNAYLPKAAITGGGTMTFNLGTTANTSWASAPSAAPPSYGGSANVVTVTSPGDQASDVGAAVNLQIAAKDSAPGQTLTFSATGLPAGLSISSSGLISGTTSAAGRFSVVVSASDGTGASGFTSFGWRVGTSAGVGPIVSGVSPDLCVDDNNSGTANGTKIQIWACNGTNAQQWTIAGSTLQVLGKCMDVSNSGTANGTKVQLWDCNGTGAQVWESDGGALRNPQSGRCLDDPGSSTTQGTQLQIYDCNGTNAQNWTLP